ncbi:MAG TPA: hypothetical protein VE961_06145 [Pyrinomonadaceae bacterium]|nr:hypothetical protein [Pyrinomonadaceae bacterium]
MLKRKSIGALGALLGIMLSTHIVNAQSTLFNIPSTDVVAKKKTYVEFDFISHFESHQDGGFQGYVPRVVVGVGKHVEIGTNVAFVDTLAPDQPVEIQPNVKYQFYSNEKNGVAASVGGILYTPIAHRAGIDTFGMLYSTVSKKFRGNYGPRLTGGGYGLVGRASGNGNEGGAIAGYEQPVSRKVNFVMDWFSGKNRFGYVTPGFAFTVSKTSALYAGYSIGNSGRKNNALFVYYGITF